MWRHSLLTHYALRNLSPRPMPHRRRHENGADDEHRQHRPLLVVAGAGQHVLDAGDEAAGLLAGADAQAALAVGVVADDAQLAAVERLAAAGADAAVDEALALFVGGAAVGAPVAALVVLEALLAGDVAATLATKLAPRHRGAGHEIGSCSAALGRVCRGGFRGLPTDDRQKWLRRASCAAARRPFTCAIRITDGSRRLQAFPARRDG